MDDVANAVGGKKAELRGDWEWNRLTYPADSLPAGDPFGYAARYTEQHIPELPPKGLSTFTGLAAQEAVVPPGVTWTEIGPRPLDNNAASGGYKYGIVTGRINSVAFASSTVAYAGGSVGGVWKTTNFSTSAPPT